jgi:hypothetical protein
MDATATPALAGMLALEGLNFVFRPPLGYQMGVPRRCGWRWPIRPSPVFP